VPQTQSASTASTNRSKLSLRDKVKGALGGSSTQRAAQPPRPAPGTSPPPLQEILGGDWVETPHGRTFVRDEWFPLEHRHGHWGLAELLDEARNHLPLLLDGNCGWTGRRETFEPTRLGFFDLETTGTSGGTGTYIFLAGLGWFVDGGFRVRQYFLDDLASETSMLSGLLQDIDALDALVTYNGRTFDVPCLETRTTLARLPFRGREKPHLDLLPIVRRLYRHRLKTCRLSDAEQRLVRFEREDDVPGWMVPSLYFDYLRAQRTSPLRGAFRHNRDDILSLLGILGVTSRFLLGRSQHAGDSFALARWWERASHPKRAQPLYQKALRLADRDGEEWKSVARQHALFLKRGGNRAEAVELWEKLWSHGEQEAGVELAKHLEHHARDLAAARDIAAALVSGAEPVQRPELEHRLHRLERKLARRADQRSSRL